MTNEQIANLLEAWKKSVKEKTECPECDGKGCEHCDGTGYHDDVDESSCNTKKTYKEAVDSSKRYAKASKPETMDDTYKGKGAKDMASDNKSTDKTYMDMEDESHREVVDAGRKGPSPKPRHNDNTKTKDKIQKPEVTIKVEGALKKALSKISDKETGYVDFDTANKKQIDMYVDKTMQKSKSHKQKMQDYIDNADYKDAESHKSALDRLKDRLKKLKKNRKSIKEDDDMNLKETRSKHYETASKGETMDDMYKGAGAKQMKKDNEIDKESFTDNEAMGPQDMDKAMTKVPTAKARKGDNMKNRDTLKTLRAKMNMKDTKKD